MLVSTSWLARHAKDEKLVVLHVARDRKDYDAGHVPGALYLAWTDLTRTRDGVPNELPPVEQLKRVFEGVGVGEGKRVVLYGDNSGLSATRAWFTLDYLGKGDMAALLDGGLQQWKAEGRPVSTDAPPEIRTARLEPRPRPEAIRTLDAMRDLSWAASNVPSPATVLIDSRPATDFSAGHIPGCVNVPWLPHLVSKENPVLKPPRELRKMYEAAGLTAGRKVVSYCGSGVQATHTYFVLRYLGYDVALYDGSMTEWKNAKDAPIAK